MKPALLVIDMQNKWIRPDKKLYPSREVAIENINALRCHFQKNEWPVFVITLEHEADGTTLSIHDKNLWNVSGSEDALTIPELQLDSSEHKIKKRRYSAFCGTNLLPQAKDLHVTHLLITGYQLSACVLSSALDAYQFDFNVSVVKDGVLDIEQQDYDYFIEYFKRADCLTFTEQWIAEHSKQIKSSGKS